MAPQARVYLMCRFVSLWRALGVQATACAAPARAASFSLGAKIKCRSVRWTCIPQVRALLALAHARGVADPTATADHVGRPSTQCLSGPATRMDYCIR